MNLNISLYMIFSHGLMIQLKKIYFKLEFFKLFLIYHLLLITFNTIEISSLIDLIIFNLFYGADTKNLLNKIITISVCPVTYSIEQKFDDRFFSCDRS